MDIAIILFLLLILLGLLGSAFYSGMETGLYTINRVRLTVQPDTAIRTPSGCSVWCIGRS